MVKVKCSEIELLRKQRMQYLLISYSKGSVLGTGFPLGKPWDGTVVDDTSSV